MPIEADIIKKEEDSTVASHHQHVQIRGEEDIEKINIPEITHNEKKSEENQQAYRGIFDGIITVKKRGVPGFWFTPFDDIIRLTGVQEALLDLAMRPEYIHKLVDRFANVYLHALE